MSGAGYSSRTYRPAIEYHAAKAGLPGLTYNLATEPGKYNITANACLFFASELSSWITGEALNVAGGKPLPVYRNPE